MTEREHIYYFDYLRVFGCISVIFMHAASMPLRAGINTNWYVTNAFTCLGFTAVPLFFMMSGYLLMTSKKTEEMSVLVKKRLPRLIVPFIFWSFVAILWILYANDNMHLKPFMSEVVKSFSEPVMIHMWYMYTLIAIYLISPFLYAGIHNIKKEYHIVIFSIIVIVSAQAMLRALMPGPLKKLFMWDILSKMQFFGGHLCTFFLGYYLGMCKKKVPNKILILIATICFAVITIGTWFLTVKSGEFDQTFQVQSEGYEILFASCIFLLTKQNLNRTKKWVNVIIKPLAGLSLPVYLCHNILLSIFAHYGIGGSTFLNIIFLTIVTAVISFFIAKTMASIKPFCFLVNGVSFKTACKKLNWQYTFNWIRNKGDI